MTSVDEICAKFRTEGRRVTPQRRAIVEVLLNEKSHLTADQILTDVRRALPMISPATVYNTLHELTELGILQELDLGLGLEQRRYDIATEKHDHMVCMRCGRVEDVARHRVERRGVLENRGFEIIDRRVIYMGYCRDCASVVETE